jgi:large subunit ribosomal protein L29
MDVSDLRAKSSDELNEELVDLRREQFNVRMQQATGEAVKPHQHRIIRRNIARVKTVIAEQKKTASVEATK